MPLDSVSLVDSESEIIFDYSMMISLILGTYLTGLSVAGRTSNGNRQLSILDVAERLSEMLLVRHRHSILQECVQLELQGFQYYKNKIEDRGPAS